MDPLSPSLKFISITFGTSEIIKLVIILGCVLIAAFFATTETALSKCNKYKIESHADDGNKKAKVCIKVLENFDKAIIDMLICINLAHIIPSMLATMLLVTLIPNNEDLASLIATIVMTLITFFFSEMLPKALASKDPDGYAEKNALILYICGIILFPISLIFRFIVKFAKKVFKVDDTENDITEDDFQDVVSDIAEEGNLEEEESEIIQAAVEFGDFTVKEVMTPVEEMVAYDATKSSKKDVLKYLTSVPYSRIPVYENSVDNIIGVLHVKKYLLAANQSKTYFRFNSLLSKPLFVDSNTKVDDMLDIFQLNRTHIAIIKDSSSKVLGMVTMEDVVEKLVGDIDEKNPPKAKLGGRK